MRVSFLLVLLLSAAVISQSEGWYGAVSSENFDQPQQPAANVTGWVNEHCVFKNETDCIFMSQRWRRDANEVVDPNVPDSRNEICGILHQNYLESEGISFAMAKAIFEEVDFYGGADGGDDILDDEEYNHFMESMELVQYCLRKSD